MQLADAAVEQAAELDRTDFADLVVDTDGMSADATATEVLHRTGLAVLDTGGRTVAELAAAVREGLGR